MAKIKGLKKLNKTISKELTPFGIKKAFLSDEYSYIFSSKQITFKLTEDTLEDDWFNEFIQERFDYDVRYPFIISLLHEVGHHKTDEQIQNELYNFCFEEKERINKEMESVTTVEDAKRLEWQYFNLPDEIVATAWAVKYAKANPKKVKKMWEKTQKALFKFYDKNNVVELFE